MPTACDPCPGKRNAITRSTHSARSRHARNVPAVRPSAAAAISCSTRSRRCCSQIATPSRRRCAPPWPTSGRGRRCTARHAHQRRAAVFRIVHAPAESAERPPRQQIADLARKRALQLLAEQLLDHLDETFAQLQRHVPGKAVADDHVGLAREKMSRASTLPMKCSGERLQQPVRLARQLVALRLFLANRQQPDARPLDAQPRPRVDRAHHAELQQIRRLALHRRAGVDEHRRPSRVGTDGASAGRSTPGSMPNVACAATTAAPVCPALTSAAAHQRPPVPRRRESTPAACAAAPAPAIPPSRRRRALDHADVERRVHPRGARARRGRASLPPTRSTPIPDVAQRPARRRRCAPAHGRRPSRRLRSHLVRIRDQGQGQGSGVRPIMVQKARRVPYLRLIR